MSPSLIIRQHGPLLSLTLNRPQSRNALNRDLLEQLITLFRELGDQPQEVDVVVLRGAGGHFCAGGDVREMSSMISAVRQGKDQLDSIHQLNALYGKLLSLAEALPQTLITLIEGAVRGGGMGLACVSDYAIAHHESSFGLPEARLGLVPAQVAPSVIKRVGLSITKRLALCGDQISAQEALRVGLIHDLFETEEQGAQLIEIMIDSISHLAPQARAETKRLLLSLADDLSIDDHINKAAEQFVQAINSPEFLEGSEAMRERRLPLWRARWHGGAEESAEESAER